MAILPPHDLLIQDLVSFAWHHFRLFSLKNPWRSYFNDKDNQVDGG